MVTGMALLLKMASYLIALFPRCKAVGGSLSRNLLHPIPKKSILTPKKILTISATIPHSDF
jgi:hypothetical protein